MSEDAGDRVMLFDDLRDGRWAAVRAVLGAAVAFASVTAFVWPTRVPGAQGAAGPGAGAAGRPHLAGDDSTVRGRLLVPDSSGGPLAGLRVVLRTAEGADSVDADPAGYFTIAAVVPREGAELIVDDVHPSGRRYHPAVVRLGPAEARAGVHVALIPTRWRIPAGTYAGRSIAIDAATAVGRSESGGRFWRLSRSSGGGGELPIGWPVEGGLIPLALRAPEWGRTLSAADSAHFWSLVAGLERDLGMKLFTPFAWDGDSIANGRVVVALRSWMRADGKTYLTWNKDGNVFDGTVYFRTSVQARSARVVSHELLHALGFGHTSAWHSVMNVGAIGIDGPTPQDVAYAQLAMRLRRLQQSEGVRYGVSEAVAASMRPDVVGRGARYGAR